MEYIGRLVVMNAGGSLPCEFELYALMQKVTLSNLITRLI
ncbi:hypothetical protein PMAG_b0129 [Pseudoalteromonas mariniglutinosa NCIMB 1770]|nr:hypothetical protein [Pseudoalteromonas mariniglutinosa NCIMB 1770]